MKNFILAITLMLSMATSFKSQAAVSAIAGAPLAVGAITMGASVTFGLASVANSSDSTSALAGFIFGYVGTIIGFIILDDDQNPALSELNKEQALKLGVSEEQVEIFNSEIEEVNGVFQNVLNTMENNKKMTFSEVRNEWLEGADFLSPETFQVLEAISAASSK